MRKKDEQGSRKEEGRRKKEEQGGRKEKEDMIDQHHDGTFLFLVVNLKSGDQSSVKLMLQLS